MEMTVPGEDVTVKEKLGELHYQSLRGWKNISDANVLKHGMRCGSLAISKGRRHLTVYIFLTAGYFDVFHALLHEAAGAETFQEALKYGEGVWETEGAQKTFDIVEKLASYTEKTTPANAND